MAAGTVLEPGVEHFSVALQQPPTALGVPDQKHDGASRPPGAVQGDGMAPVQQGAGDQQNLYRQRQIVGEATSRGPQVQAAEHANELARRAEAQEQALSGLL